jgi:hypothetical protein
MLSFKHLASDVVASLERGLRREAPVTVNQPSDASPPAEPPTTTKAAPAAPSTESASRTLAQRAAAVS